MWVDLSPLGLKITQSLNRDIAEGMLIEIFSDNERAEEIVVRLQQHGFSDLGQMGVQEGLVRVMHKPQPTFNLSDIKDWLGQSVELMVKKEMLPLKSELYDILERVAIFEEPVGRNKESIFDINF